MCFIFLSNSKSGSSPNGSPENSSTAPSKITEHYTELYTWTTSERMNVQLQEISILLPWKVFVLHPPPTRKFQLSFVLCFENFDFYDPPPHRNFWWPSMGWVCFYFSVQNCTISEWHLSTCYLCRWKKFGLSFCNCISCKHECDGHSLILTWCMVGKCLWQDW